MASVHGRTCRAVFDETPITNVRGWSITCSIDTAEDTIINTAANPGRTRTTGVKRATATVTALQADEGYAPGVSTAQSSLVLYRSGTTSHGYYSIANARCIGATQNVSVSDVETITYNFVINGTVQFRTA